MGEFRYKARDFRGKLKTGTVSANDKATASAQIRSMRLTPISVKPESDSFLSRLIYKDKKGNFQVQLGSGLPSLKELSIFAKQFSIMIERGVPLIQSLALLSSNQKSVYFAKCLERVQVKIENGATLSASIAEYPKIFDNLFVSMIKAGEISGNLDVVLRDLVRYLEKSAKLRSQLKSAMVYPMIILMVAMGITYGILVFLVPVFAQQYKEAGKPLPAVTQIVVDVSDFLQAKMIHLLVGIIGGSIAFKKFRVSKTGRPIVDKLLLTAPVTREVVRAVAISRFTSTMATMMASGVSIMEALSICAESAGNVQIERFVMKVRDKIAAGATFSQPLAEGDLFPPMVVSMVAVGEQTGALDETLAKVSEIYEEEVDTSVQNMSAMFQPILMVGIGVILGFVVIALYLPIFDQASFAGGEEDGNKGGAPAGEVAPAGE